MEFITYMADCSDDESSSDNDSEECDNSGKINFIHDGSSSSEEEEGYIPPNPYVSCFLFLFADGYVTGHQKA